MKTKVKRQLPRTQEGWDALREAIITDLLGCANAVQDYTPTDYPGPQVMAAYSDFHARLTALSAGLPMGDEMD